MFIKKYPILIEAKNRLRALSTGDETVLFVSTSDGKARVQVKEVSASNFDQAWQKAQRYLEKFRVLPKWLKLEVQTSYERLSPEAATLRINQVERNNYFPFGIAFKKDGSCSFTTQEIVGNALLTPSPEHKIGVNAAKLQLNENNLKGYIKRKYRLAVSDPLNYFDTEWAFFQTEGLFIEGGKIFTLETAFFGNGTRVVTQDNQQERIAAVITHGRHYLANQITADGSFIYGYFPTYNKRIPGYNSVRHYSSLYALLETVEHQQKNDPTADTTALLAKIKLGIDWGLANLTLEKDGIPYVLEKLKKGGELKLGAQAMVILMLAKYEEITQLKTYHQAMLDFLEGIKTFIDPEGNTTHVLNDDLTVKESFRIVYYDGEALFAIMRAYPFTQDDQWLALGELLMKRFIKGSYERYHDHWLSYSVNELTTYVPKKEYFEFGVKNALNHLSFMENRDTAYPTFLELLVAARKMFVRIENSEFQGQLFRSTEYQRLIDVTEKRAIHELRTGVMWPELAQYCASPATIAYGFYARHDRMRMRIDDAEHFLSGFINYTYLLTDPELAVKLKPAAAVKAPVAKAKQDQSKALAIGGGDIYNKVPAKGKVTTTPTVFDTAQAVANLKSLTAAQELKLDFSQFTGQFLDAALAADLQVDDFEYFPYPYPTASTHTAFLNLSDERIHQITKGKKNWTDREQFILTYQDRFSLIVTEQPIEALAGKKAQFIVPNVWDFMHEVAAYLRNDFAGPVIAMTGSVGKSSTRLMINHLLNGQFNILSNRGNHNVRLATPLYMAKLIQKPEILSLELSLNTLNSRDKGAQSTLVQPTIAILTSVGFAHMEGTDNSLSLIAEVKSRIFEGLDAHGTAIINADIDQEALDIALTEAKKQTSHILTYSMTGNGEADINLIMMKTLKELTEVTVSYQQQYYTYYLKMSSPGMVENSLAAFLTLISLGLNPEDYFERFTTFKSLPKVMALHTGYLTDKKVAIIDDTHNAAIPSMINAIQAFSAQLPYYSGAKILALGQVANLGEHAQALHELLIPYINDSGADFFFGYGKAMREVVDKVSIPSAYFDNMDDYVAKILATATEQSFILLKGSVSESDYSHISGRLIGQLRQER
jgi:UDP-N-acetylmuramyl pentapeptide synthase